MGQGSTARKPAGQQVAYLRARITRAGGVAQTITVGILPAGANILQVASSTRVIFDGTTPVFTMGITGTLAGIVASVALGAALGTVIHTLAATALIVPDVDQTVLATFTVTGGTVGTADFQVAYTVPDETP